jgi:cytochrome c5
MIHTSAGAGHVIALLVAAMAAIGSPPPAGAQQSMMRDMMRQMMRGIVPAPGMTAESLPDPGAEGARLLLRFCEQCHDLPSPRYKTADQWPEVFERMTARMRMVSAGMRGREMMGMHRMEAPDLAESRALLAYLVRNAMVVAREEDLQAAAPADRAAFRQVCSRCHALPSPSLHPPQEWPGVVARMRVNMQAMEKPTPTPEELEAVQRVLQTASSRAYKQ